MRRLHRGFLAGLAIAGLLLLQGPVTTASANEVPPGRGWCTPEGGDWQGINVRLCLDSSDPGHDGTAILRAYAENHNSWPVSIKAFHFARYRTIARWGMVGEQNGRILPGRQDTFPIVVDTCKVLGGFKDDLVGGVRISIGGDLSPMLETAPQPMYPHTC
ncbi:hypothetical protein [Streptomyces ehimensis]|uniref:Secreted protein n=1 Tax=Streptomyces ehimensis TaxID=68195 RepID=A0ABV9BU50_9ACTN